MRGVLALALAAAATTAVAAVDRPLDRVRVVLHDGDPPRLVVRARWRGPTPALHPASVGAVLRVTAGPGEGDTGALRLPASGWRRVGRALRYAGGRTDAIRRVVLRGGARGGTLAVAARVPALGPQPTRVALVLAIGSTRLCAEVGLTRRDRRLGGTSRTPPASCPCPEVFPSTWAAVQRVVFDDHACRQPICHGAAPGSGGLDLHPAVAYGSLIDVPSTYDAGRIRVVPGSAAASLLWLKLAAGPLDLEDVPRSPMPIGNPPLSLAELDAVARWIDAGAPETGAVAGTAALLDVCLDP